MEKRRKRRESHNAGMEARVSPCSVLILFTLSLSLCAVERWRRDNINDRIQELSVLVPDCSEDNVNTNSNAFKANKGVILRKSADYIRQLQEMNRKLLVQLQQQQNGGAGMPLSPTFLTSVAAAAAGDLHDPYGSINLSDMSTIDGFGGSGSPSSLDD